MPKVGEKLKEMRLRRGLSAREIALRTGVSHSTISLIERDRISPSIDTLSAIVEALGSTIVGFFGELSNELAYSPFYKENELIEIGNTKNVSYRVIGFNHPNRQLLMLKETYAKNSDSGENSGHTGQEAGTVIRGSIELTVGNRSEVLHTGDAYYFDSRLPHRFRNTSDETTEIVSAITPPTY